MQHLNKERVMFATIAQQRMDARAEFQQGEEQSRLRERLKDYTVKDFVKEAIEAGDTAILLEEIITSTVAKFNEFKMKIVELDLSRLKKNSNYMAINGEINAVRDSFTEYIDNTLDANLTLAEWDIFKNKLIENAIDGEYEIVKLTKE